MIKEYIDRGKKPRGVKDNWRRYRYVIRLPYYGKSSALIDRMYYVAVASFGIIPRDDIEIVICGGSSRYKQTMGIEWDSDKEPPGDYVKIDSLKMTLS